jgi:hypothetical protein
VKITDFLALDWTAPGLPLIEPPRFSPVIADPSFLFPEEAPEGKWELFAHSAWGIHRFSSPDGISWNDRGLAVWNAMRPFIRPIVEAGSPRYRLYFEAYPPLALVLTALPRQLRWRSRISLSRSDDLSRWSSPEVLLEPRLPWASDSRLGSSVSNPCLVEGADGRWLLYYSASLSWIEDCEFCEPR